MTLRGPDPMTYALAQFERQEADEDRRQEALNKEAEEQLEQFEQGNETELLGEGTIDNFLSDSDKAFKLLCQAWNHKDWDRLGPALKQALVEYADEQLDDETTRDQLEQLLCDRAHDAAMERGLERMERFQ